MESPVAIVKSNVSVGKILAFVVTGLVVFAILDAAKLTNWILFPVTNLKAKFSKPAA